MMWPNPKRETAREGNWSSHLSFGREVGSGVHVTRIRTFVLVTRTA